MPGRSTKGSPARVDAAERRAQVAQMRRARLPFAEIGRRIGVSEQRAWQIYQEAIAAIPAAAVNQHRAEELVLVDDATRALLGIAADKSVTPRTRVEAWNSIRSWAEHKARILGLNAATKVEVSEDVRIQILALAAELGTVEPAGAGRAAGDAEARGIGPPPA